MTRARTMRTILGVLATALACGTHAGGGDERGDAGGKADDLGEDFPAVDPADFDFRTDAIDDYDEVVDGQGIAFADTILGRRANKFSEIGPHNGSLSTATTILKNFADLAVAFGRDFETIGFDTCADLSGVDPFRTSSKSLSTLSAFKIVRGCLFQRIRPELGAASMTPMGVFVPNHQRVDFRLVADGSESSFPNGQRPDEQVASMFTSLLLDLEGGICEDSAGAGFDGTRDRPCTVDTLQGQDPAQFGDLPLNPPTNDVEFVRNTAGRLAFPYLPGPHSPAPYDLGQ